MSEDRIEKLTEVLDDLFIGAVTEMMEREMDERVSVIVDPETSEQTIHNVDGSEIYEEQFYALSFFEMGWFAALRAIESLGNSDIDSEIEKRYPSDSDQTTEGDT